MKYGVIPTSIGERIALWAGKIPVPLLDALFSLMKARSLMAGVSLGIFETLRNEPLTAAEVAARNQLDVECTELLLRALVGIDYLGQQENRYTLSPLSRDTMIAGAKNELWGYLQWNYTQWEMVARLEDLIRTGRGIDFHRTMSDPQKWADYQRAMLEVARFEAPVVADNIPVKPGAGRLLDLAGAHGLIGAAICRRHPPMKSDVLDLPEAIETARALAQAEKIDDVVSHRAGDLLTDEYGKDYDVVLLSNILHHFQEDANLEILRRSRNALAPQGTIAIWEIETSNLKEKASESDAAALFFRLTSNARCYHGGDYAQWLEQAGFTQIEAIRPMLAPGNVLVAARRE